MAKWKEAQSWEAGWWDNCVNTYGEEEKQIVYARKMGLRFFHNTKSPYNIDMGGRSVIDIGGGPVSLLLKCTGFVRATVVDPLDVPHWVVLRYEEAGIMFEQVAAEKIEGKGYDEAWIYNCLQHTANPKRIIDNALKAAKIVRIFEWIETHVNEGHPHSFTASQLDQWLGGEGKTELLKYPTLRGKCYYGIFVGR
jgi:hypothetical protein